MGTETLSFKIGTVINSSYPDRSYPAIEKLGTTAGQDFLASFSDFSRPYAKILSVTPYVYIDRTRQATANFKVSALHAPFDTGATWNNSGVAEYEMRPVTYTELNKYVGLEFSDPADIADILANGARFGAFASGTINTGKNTEPPRCDVQYDDEPIKPVVSLASGRTLYRESASVVSWTVVPESNASLIPISQASAVVKWRANGTEHTLQVGENSEITFASGTFSTESVEICVEVTAHGGGVAATPWTPFNVLDIYITGESPKTGYIDSESENTFTWGIRQRGTEQNIDQASAVFSYKIGGTTHTISVGTDKMLTVPANTFSGTELQWKISITTPNGNTAESTWYNLSMVEATSQAVGISPADSVVNGEQEAVFKWSHIITTGTQQTKFDLEISQDLQTWTQVASGYQSETMTLLDAYALPAGSVYWRVRTYNRDGIAGTWSNPLHIVVILPPPTPSITITSNAPKWSVRWASVGQTGFEVQFDGETVRSGFGTETEYVYTDYAADGAHTVRVRTQNEFSIWSEWASAAINVVNVPGNKITLTASVESPEVKLVSAGGDGETYVYYRNGVKIAETAEQMFVDKFSSGKAVYFVRTTYADGNYTQSNSVETDAKIKTPWIYCIDSGEWLSLKMSEAQYNNMTSSYNHSSQFLHFPGIELPFVEFGTSVDNIISFSAGFVNNSEDLRKFERMQGKTVFARFPDGTAVFGAVVNYERNHGAVYTEYTSKITEIEFDEVDYYGKNL